MPYIVSNSDGSLTVTVADTTVDASSYSLALVGRSVSNYGQYFAQNTIRHLENFASTIAPSPVNRLVGQLWYDKSEELLRVWDGAIWKRATNIVVGNEEPTVNVIAGTAFYDTRINKLKVHNGAAFREASYGGEVTTAYSENTDVGSPRFYGARIRTLFLEDEYGDPHPVLALSYVKNTSGAGASANRGTTLVGEQFETIMALYSDSAFNIAADTNTPIDGDLINFQPELVGSDGIATSRPGRIAGQILKGVNTRSEYEQETSSIFNTVYILGQLGGPDPVGSNVSPRVPQAFFQEVDVGNLLTVSFLDVTNDVDVGGEIIVTGNVESESTVVCANLIVGANTTLNGETTINGELFVNGVNTQTIGQTGNVIETYYGNVINTVDIEVSDTANIETLNVVNLTASSDALFESNIEVQGNTVLVDTETHDLHVTGNADVDGTFNVDGHADIRNTVTFHSASTHNDEISAGFGSDNDLTITHSGTNATIENTTGELYIQSDGITLRSETGTEDYLTADVNGAVTLYYNSDKKLETTSAGISVTGNVTGSYFVGTATQAQYADLAEKYAADQPYEPGTVVKLGGSAEITQTTIAGDFDVFGVISTDPAYLMNAASEGLPVALQGRVPLKVIGTVKKGQRLISSEIPGVAVAMDHITEHYDPRMIVGRSLTTKNTDEVGYIEAVIGIK